jgi:multiple sugar transport system permease protein
MPMVAVVTIWWTNGFNVLLFIAGLRNIPTELYEAAALDGATTWQKFRRVTWPLLWPVTALILTLQLILQLKIFDQIYLLSGGGPFNSSFVLLLKVYREAFQMNNGGYASAVATVLFLLIVIVSVLQFQLLRIRRNS